MTIALGGELDLAGSGVLASEVRRALSPRPEALEIDAEDLSFADSAGLLTVLVARDEARAKGVDFTVTAVSTPVERMIRLAGLGELLPASPG